MAEQQKKRNIALLSHSGAGKTSLLERVLFECKITSRVGKVEEGNTVSDFEPEEIKRGGSIQTSIVPVSCNGININILDTPGYDDFVGEIIPVFRVVESAVILIDATAGIEVGSEKAWQLCEDNKMPRLIVVNKLDRETTDFSAIVQNIEEAFGRKCVPIQSPVGSEVNFKSVLDLMDIKENSTEGSILDIESGKERLIEAIAESDDQLATKYLEGEDISKDELIDGLKSGVVNGDIVPVIAISAETGVGIEELLKIIDLLLPSPAESKKSCGVDSDLEKTENLSISPDGPLTAFVFKTTADPFVGKLSFFRIYSGSLKSNSEVTVTRSGGNERIGQVFSIMGKEQKPVNELTAGDIGAVAKLSDVVTSDTLVTDGNKIKLPLIDFPVGNYQMSISPKTKSDVDKMSGSLSRLVEEDATLKLERQQDTSETLLSGFGEAHLSVAIEKVKRKFGAELEVNVPKVPYKETISSVATSEYKHKRQSGGHGQYGHVILRVEPQNRGKGFEFASEIVGGAVPKEYIPAVEKGILKTLTEGIIANCPVVDIKVVLYDGSYHDVDSSGISFEIAAGHALKQGFLSANPCLLEPIVKLNVIVPDSKMGDVIGDLNGKRGKILGMNPQSGVTDVEVEIPHSEVLRYATELRSQTQGRGTYSISFSHYEMVPPHISDPIIASRKKNSESE